MRVWLYYRLSRDEDEELNSLKNQRKILEDYALSNGYDIMGESFDDNVSGMHFNREGISKIYETVEARLIDAIVVKDLSRLGRHKTQTAMFIDFLRENDVRVLSVTENIDTFNENDDMLVSFKGIFNDYYARDISRKVRAGFRQKQKEGFIMIPPMGYFKDKNTGEILIMEEPAAIVRQIFEWYVTEGYGLKSIAKMLNAKGMKSASYYQKQFIGKKQGYHKPEITFRHLWANTAVKRILQNEFYCGTLVCHKEETNKINKTRKLVPTENQIRHEDFVPAIISKEMWQQAQFLIGDKVERGVRAAPGKPMKRYTGLLKCADCGCVFVGKNRKWIDNEYTEYNCNGYHRYGKEHCSPHSINDMVLDKIIYDELIRLKNCAEGNFKSIEKDVKKWLAQKSDVDKRVSELQNRINTISTEIENILMERINDKENRQIYDSMLQKRRDEKTICEEKLEEIKNLDKTIKKRKSEIKSSIDLIDSIITDNAINHLHLRMLVETIEISERRKQGLDVAIVLKADFGYHFNEYENGDVSKAFMAKPSKKSFVC